MHLFKIAKEEGPVGEGVSESLWATLPAIVKTNEKVNTCIANEYISGILGRFLGVPVAPGAVVQLSASPKVYGYASLKFNLAQESLPDVDPAMVAEKLPRLSAGLVVFDILIANSDRHQWNLSAILHGKRPELLVFDHSHALLGYDSDSALSRLARLRDRLGVSGGSVTEENRHCLLDHLTDETYFQEWVARVRAIPDHLLTDVCEDMKNLGFVTDMQCVEAVKFLKHRRAHIADLIHANRGEFKGIRQWGLSLW